MPESKFYQNLSPKAKMALKVLKIIGLVLLFVLLGALLVNSLLCVFVEHYYPTWGNKRLFAIVSDSMEPEIMTGNMIVCAKPASEDEIQVGTVITYEYKQNNSTILITHRVMSINVNPETGVKTYTTKGDNAGVVDSYRPTFDDVVGVFTGKQCGFFGYVFGFLQSAEGAIALILTVMIAVIAYVVVRFVNLVNTWRAIATMALKKSGALLNTTDNDELVTIADVIGIITKDPATKAEQRRKDKKLNWFIKTGMLPKRPYSDELEFDPNAFDGEGVTRIDLASREAVASASPEDAIAAEALQKSGRLLAETKNEDLVTIADVIGIATKKPSNELERKRKDKKLNWYLRTGTLPARPYKDDEELDVDAFEGEGVTKLNIPLYVDSRDGDNPTQTLEERHETMSYSYSCMARLIQLKSESKEWYSQIKNALLSYNGVRVRAGKKYEAFYVGRKAVARLTVRGKTLCLLLALNVDDYVNTKYGAEAVNSSTPCMIKVKSARKAKYSCELIAEAMKLLNVDVNANYELQDYYMPYEGAVALMQKGLVKRNIKTTTKVYKVEFVSSDDLEEEDKEDGEVTQQDVIDASRSAD